MPKNSAPPEQKPLAPHLPAPTSPARRIPPTPTQESQQYATQEESQQLPVQQETYPQASQNQPSSHFMCTFPLTHSSSPPELFHHSQIVMRTQRTEHHESHPWRRTLKAGEEPNQFCRLKTKTQFKQQWPYVLWPWSPSKIFQLWKILKPLLEVEKVDKKKVSNLFNFRGAPMVTIFICLAGSQTQGVWKFLEKASQTDTSMRLAE